MDSQLKLLGMTVMGGIPIACHPEWNEGSSEVVALLALGTDSLPWAQNDNLKIRWPSR